MSQAGRVIDALDLDPPRATVGTRWTLVADRMMGLVPPAPSTSASMPSAA
jgi:hypothetical protein